MNRRMYLYLLVLVSVISVSGGCAAIRKDAERTRADRESVTDAETLSSYLRKNGVSLMYDGPFTSTFMTTPGESFTVMSGGQLYVFKYKTTADALGSTQWAKQTWGGRPERMQMYRKDTLVVVYVGDDPKTTSTLLRIMGSQIL